MVVVLMAVMALVVYTLRWNAVRITAVHVTTNGGLSEDVLTQALHDQLAGTYLRFVPKDSAFLVSPDSLADVLMARFPRILSVDIQRAGMQTLQATITERSPEALWCGDVVPPVASDYSRQGTSVSEEAWGTCYFMDATGFLYAKAPLYTGDVFNRYYGSLTQAEPVGQHFVPTEEFTRWEQLYHDLFDESYALRAVLFVDDRDVELYLKGGIRLLALRTEDLGMLKQRIIALLTSDALDLTKPIEYVDLRFGTKGYVRYADN
jgi:cell division septal protein FtsQ